MLKVKCQIFDIIPNNHHMIRALCVNAISASNLQQPEDGMFDHYDVQDITYQYALTIGVYEGVNLVCKTKNGRLINVSNRRRFFRFDGRLPHK